MARLTIWLLGFEVFSISNEGEPDQPEAALNGGTLGSTPAGFTARYDRPDEVDPPERG